MNPRDIGPPATARELLGWIRRRDNSKVVFRRAVRLGVDSGYGDFIKRWTPSQVADIYRLLTIRPEKGSMQWGGVAGSGRVTPK